MRADVARWFERRTSTSAQWHRERLAERKGDSQVSVVLPAKDEEATVGAIVTALRRELVEAVPLIDELVVIDSGSQDATAQVATDAGARVVRQDRILPRLGNVPGKGEALWKSLLVTEGDVIAFIDADLRSFDPQFAVGIVGPLLGDPSIQFVKAFYERPLMTDHEVKPAGGGRVTELVARPLLNLHWPVLAGFVQPLAGEYAARRSLLEQIPFMSGYGVEIGMLVDVVERVGVDAMAQVDLGCRHHRNHDITTLGRMAAQVQLALLSKLDGYGRTIVLDQPATEFTQFSRRGDRFVPTTSDVGVSERPPMMDVPEYREHVMRQVS